MNEREFHDLHYAGEAETIEAGALFRRVHDRAARQFLKATGIGAGHRLLSLGCGDGAMEVRLGPHVGEIVGVDLSSVAIDRARRRATEAGLRNLSFVLSDGGLACLSTLGQFDAVVAFAFLHHLDDGAIAQTLLASNGALRAGGVLYSSDPSRRRLVGLFKGMVRSTYERYHSPEERELDPSKLAALAVAAGFSRPAIRYTDFFLGPLAWLAPGTPAAAAAVLETLDNLALGVPLLRGYASSFVLLARKGAQ